MSFEEEKKEWRHSFFLTFLGHIENRNDAKRKKIEGLGRMVAKITKEKKVFSKRFFSRIFTVHVLQVSHGLVHCVGSRRLGTGTTLLVQALPTCFYGKIAIMNYLDRILYVSILAVVYNDNVSETIIYNMKV